MNIYKGMLQLHILLVMVMNLNIFLILKISNLCKIKITKLLN